MIWVLPSRGRRRMLTETLEACHMTGMTQRLIVICDSRVPSRPDFLPANAVLWQEPWDMGDCMRQVLRRFPNEETYGWLADDLRPRYPQKWDVAMSEAARAEPVVVDCDDGWLAGDYGLRLYSLCGAFCWSGELIRTVGWWAPPWARQGGIDDAWVELCCKRHALRRHMPEILVEHLHYKCGKREVDETDDHTREGEDYIQEDLKRFMKWRVSNDCADVSGAIWRMLQAKN